MHSFKKIVAISIGWPNTRWPSLAPGCKTNESKRSSLTWPSPTLVLFMAMRVVFQSFWRRKLNNYVGDGILDERVARIKDSSEKINCRGESKSSFCDILQSQQLGHFAACELYNSIEYRCLQTMQPRHWQGAECPRACHATCTTLRYK